MDKLIKLRNFCKKYERCLIPGALVFGFITDVLTFNLVNFTIATIILLLHLILIGANIVVINFYEAQKISGRIFSYWRILAPFSLQYSFGNLFSAFLIFYSNSGSFSASWPFIIVIIFLMIGNEIFRKYNVRPLIQISIYFFAIFSYLNLVFPYIFRSLGPAIFLLSGTISVLIIVSLIKFLSHYISKTEEEKKSLQLSIGLIFLTMNVLYFANLIPPIPLSIKDIGVYHDIKRVNHGYVVETEECRRLDRCILSSEIRHISNQKDTLYLYSAVYAPSGMNLEVVNEWQKYDYNRERWITKAEIPFSIYGGRDEGYRWYSYYYVSPGYFRVNIKTKSGQVIGQKKFHVIEEEGMERKIEKIE